eukprot:scaffold3614_cov123-Isochrysis_galbana.AAC.8
MSPLTKLQVQQHAQREHAAHTTHYMRETSRTCRKTSMRRGSEQRARGVRGDKGSRDEQAYAVS